MPAESDIIHNSLSPHSKSTSWAMQWSRNRQDDITVYASAIMCSICSSQPGTPPSYLRSIQTKQSKDVLLGPLAAAVIPHALASTFLLRSTGPALTQGYKNSSREPGGIVLLCQPREDKRKTPEPFWENERKIFPKTVCRPFTLSFCLSFNLGARFGSTLAFPISREWRAGLHGRGTDRSQSVRLISAAHALRLMRSVALICRCQNVHSAYRLMPRCHPFQRSFLRGHFYTMHFRMALYQKSDAFCDFLYMTDYGMIVMPQSRKLKIRQFYKKISEPPTKLRNGIFPTTMGIRTLY